MLCADLAQHLSTLIALLAVMAGASTLAPRLRVPLPVLLALSGIALAFVPVLPRTPIDPNLILLFLLPPLLYGDAFDTSWVDFKRWLRPIVMLAVGLVGVTILAVGLVAKAMLPEVPWAVCFVLGAIVSPTDTVAVQALVERLRIPRRSTAILGGESLVNDATGLVGVQLGVAVVLSGSFEGGRVALSFAWVAGGGVAIGAVCGLAFALVNRFVRDTRALFAFSLLAPYVAYATANALQSSGVLAVVVAGFVVAWRIHLVTPDARLDLYASWGLILPLLNGVCFVFIGYETPRLLRDTALAESQQLVVAGLAVGVVTVVTRLAWVFPAAYVPLYLFPKVREREGGYPGWRNVLLAGWCGVRGAVSLAAALALPTMLADGRPFPGRDAVIACTLCVILLTLFMEGSTLQVLARWLGIKGDGCSAAEERAAREAMLLAGIARLDEFCSERSCPLSVHRWRELMADELATLRSEDAEEQRLAGARLEVSRDVRRAVAEAQSRELLHQRDTGAIDDRAYVALQLELDREVRSLNGRGAEGGV